MQIIKENKNKLSKKELFAADFVFFTKQYKKNTRKILPKTWST
ncbi:hypothetical protein [Planococcus glaciei]|nr:hypothetical protein [Planococcus glaciei]